MPQHSWFKLFGDRRWAECFLNGEILFRSLSYFQDYESPTNKQAIGDRYEGIRAGMPTGGIITTDHNTGKLLSKFETPFEFNALVRAEEIFVFCLSRCFKDELVEDFCSTACVEIFNKSQFFTRLRAALPPEARLIYGPVHYYDYASEAGLKALLIATPEDIVRAKELSYRKQEEYRFAFSTTGALEVGSRRLCLREFKSAPPHTSHPEQHLRLGDLSDICHLHLCHPAAQAASS